jgi:acyl-CoA-binding protein
MSDLQAQFKQAVADSKTLTKRPGNDVMLQLYSLYKQATSGDVSGKRPGMLDPVGRAKYDAWKKLKGTSADDAMQEYVGVIDGLKTNE